MKLFLSPETIKKFHPLSYGSNLAGELPGFGAELPTAVRLFSPFIVGYLGTEADFWSIA